MVWSRKHPALPTPHSATTRRARAFSTLLFSPLSLSHSLQRLLAERLEQCGWRDQVAALARDELGGGGGDGGLAPPRTTADALAAHLRPAARAAVPDGIKAELLAELRAAILNLTSVASEEA